MSEPTGGAESRTRQAAPVSGRPLLARLLDLSLERRSHVGLSEALAEEPSGGVDEVGQRTEHAQRGQGAVCAAVPNRLDTPTVTPATRTER